jgi:hypothetical protein
VTAFDELRGIIESIYSIIYSIDEIVDDNKDSDVLPKLIEAVFTLKQLFSSIVGFKNKIQNNFAGSPLLNQTDILASITQKLIDYLFIKFLQRNYGTAYASLLFLGLIEEQEVEDPEDGFNSDYIKRTVKWNTITNLLKDPVDSIKSNFLTGNQIEFDKLLYIINEIGVVIGLRTDYTDPEITLLDTFNQNSDLTVLSDFDDLNSLYVPIYESETTELAIDIYPIMDTNTSQYTGLGVGVKLGGEVEIDITDLLKLIVKFSSSLQDSIGFSIDSSGNFRFINNLFQSPQDIASDANFKVKISFAAGSDDQVALFIGDEQGSSFQIGGAKLSFGIDKKNDTNLFIETELSNGKVALVPSDPDGFISKILPEKGIESNFDLGIGFSSKEGLYFIGTSGLEIKLPAHFNLGVIEILSLTFGVYFKDENIPVTLGGSFAANLGPLAATVENIGLKLNFKVANNNDGNLGPLDLSLGFKPPNGVGLVLDAGVVKGGGYLYFDFEDEEYAGALELTFSDFLSLKAIGLITTKMPDGSKGFSLVIIITAEFTIQLGYGFVFLGAGGLLGLHRTMKLEPLAEGVRTGATANILFPTNIVENAPKIISDIRIFFPVELGKFLIGPMAKLGWGTPTLISLSLGIIIEIRVSNGAGIERIAILGVLKCILPDEKAALLVLQVNFIGAIDFQKKHAYFFASIFESRVLSITIEGEMGVLVAWGDDANFVVSVGGFHPRFNPPPLPFPVPKRVALNILNESWGKIRAQGYFAVTTNTVQFGNKIEIYFGMSDFKIEGHLAFDALFQFNPFYFIVEISGKVSLKVFGFDLFTISLKFSLEGTSPWRAKGYGKLKILFFSFKAKFDKTWGKKEDTKLPPVSIVDLLQEQLKNTKNWQSIAPDSNNLLVTLRELHEPAEDDEDPLVLHPIGKLRASQRAIPLEIRIDKVGSQKPNDANKLELEATGSFVAVAKHKENFARAQFQDMKDSKKLSSPAYEKEVGGLDLSVSDDQFKFGRIAVRHVRYELITIDTAYKRSKKRFFAWLPVLFAHFFANNAVHKSSISHKLKRELQPFDEKIKIYSGAYTVANNKDNKPINKKATNFTSFASAEEFMNEQIAKQQEMAENIHVIPNNEVNLAA